MTLLMIEIDKMQEAVVTIWSTMLGLEALPGMSKTPALKRVGGSFLMSCIQITGAWQGAIRMDCSATLARRIAAIMFAMPEHDVTPDEINDALGELTNMVGGSFKSFLPEPSALSLPAVAEGSDYFFQVLSCRTLAQFSFCCEGKPFQVSVHESTH